MVQLEASKLIKPLETATNSGSSMTQAASGYSVQGGRGALLTATNRRINEWDEVLHNPLMRLIAVDRQVDHPIIFERNVFA
ncbi:hypothetical protein E1N52_38885 [Paraburkholderia guartelaensis]|uniref:Uncharacterized protein n=1 Tax=Paraburkholderia guartelaensis TaxID=2546446 RepID=A0A4R5L237_9BURK|nr:hypothetical protein [Paraburkholderia guartelaensis]TDG02610.1 hypothetical protein E1N52_38885 [Paraburkholderia guartelaensis]